MAKEEKKRIMYIGHKGDENTPIVLHGLRFDKGVVQPVSDEVYEYLKNVKNFVEVRGVKTSVMDWFSDKEILAVSGATIGVSDVDYLLDKLP